MTWRMLIPIAVLLIGGVFVGLHDKIFPPKPIPSETGFVLAPAPNPAPAATVQVTAPPQASSRQTPPPLAEPAAKKEAIPATSRGEVVNRVLPKVSSSAQRTITGKIKVSVRVEVNPSGKVTSAKLTSPGPSKYFANLALNAARSWEFTAPQVDGQSVSSAWNVKFLFGRTSTQAIPERAR
jgi:TonB family protein